MSRRALIVARRECLELGALPPLLAKDAAGEPAFYIGQWVPSGAPKPYVLANYRTLGTDQSYMRTGPMDFDVFTAGPSTKAAEQIRDIIVARLDSAVLEGEENYYRFSEVRGDGPAPTEDNTVARWRFTFDVRYWRTAFLESRLGG